MNKCIIILVFGLTCMVSRGDYPSIARAEELFTPMILNSTNYHIRESMEFKEFANSLNCATNIQTEIEMETFLVSVITSVVVNVSTNEVDKDSNSWLYGDRGSAFKRLSTTFRNFPTNAVNCLAIAEYLGRVKTVDFPDNIANTRYHHALITTNDAERAEHQAKMAAWWKERNHQHYVARANHAVIDYRDRLFRVCNITVRGMRPRMSDEEFATFTNNLVTVSCANETEQRHLFEGLK